MSQRSSSTVPVLWPVLRPALALGLALAACGTTPAPIARPPAPAPPLTPTSPEALMCEPLVPGEEEDGWGPSQRTEPEDPRDLCAVADSNIAAAEDAILGAQPPQAPAAATSDWDHQRDPAGLGKVVRRFGLGADELAILRREGFVATDRFDVVGYAWAYHEVFQSELPVFVSLDSLFSAIQAGHDHMLADLERRRLAPVTADLLARMHCGLAAAAADYPPDTARDLDLYLTVARRLLSGNPVPPALGDASLEPAADDLVSRALAASSMDTVALFGRDRVIDFTQFQPRGHYAGDAGLELYFRAAMWLSRIELNLASRSCRSSAPGDTPDPSETPREGVLGLALADLASRTGALADLHTLDRAWSLFAGRREDVPLEVLVDLGKTIPVRAPDAAARLRQALGDRFQRAARTHYMPQGSTVLPAIATLLGPRIPDDVAMTRPLVHGEIPERHALHAADFAYALGADRAKAYLADDLATFPGLAAGLERAREVLATAPPSETADLYGAWLDAIRAAARTTRPALGAPSFMATDAYADLRLGTTVAAYAGIRHNHVLVSAQSYDEGGCSIPDGWVEPAPEVLAALVAYADRGVAIATELDPDGAAHLRGYFERVGKVLRTLSAIVAREVAGLPLDEVQRRFLGQVAELTPGSTGGPPTYTGWYFDLFQRREQDGLKASELIADVYTSSEAGITYLGTGTPLLGVFVVDRGGPPRVMVGPVARAFEYHGALDRRLGDADATALPVAGKLAPWTASYLAPTLTEPSFGLNYAGDLGGGDEGAKPGEVVITLESQEVLGPVTVALLDHHRQAVTSQTRKVAPGTTRFTFKWRVTESHPLFEGIAVTIGKYRTWTGVSDVCGCASMQRGSYRLPVDPIE